MIVHNYIKTKQIAYNESSKWKAPPRTSPRSCLFKADEQSVSSTGLGLYIKFSGYKSSRYGDTEAKTLIYVESQRRFWEGRRLLEMKPYSISSTLFFLSLTSVTFNYQSLRKNKQWLTNFLLPKTVSDPKYNKGFFFFLKGC